MSTVVSMTTQDMDSEFNGDQTEVTEKTRPGWIIFMAGILISGLIDSFFAF